MKIVCDSCGAKYSIADDKVRGKVFKIRCKKCSAVIVVRGDEGGAAAAGAAPASAGDAVWHLVLDGEQQGPFAPAQIAEMLSAGSVDWEAYAWREGFDDWKHLKDIEPLVQAIMGGQEAASAPMVAPASVPAPAPGRTSSPPGGGEGGGLFGGGGGDIFGGAAAPAPAATARQRGGADLFAKAAPEAATPFGGHEEEEEEDVVASANPRVSADQAKLTGTRNENSVLFSLQNLQALATGAPSPKSAPPQAGHATGEGSGLIDIKALATSTGPAGARPMDRVDDLLAIGTGGSAFAAPLSAPVLSPVAERESSSKTGLYVGLGIAGFAVVAAAAVAVIVLTRPPPPPPVVATAPTTPTTPTTPTSPTSPDPAAATPTTPTTPTTPDPAAAGTGTTTAAGTPGETSTSGAGSTASERERERDREHRDRERGGGSAGGATAATPTTPRTPAAGGATGRTGAASGASAGSRDLESLLDRAVSGTERVRPGAGGGGGGGGGAAGGGGGASGLPETPSRGEIASGMNGVAGAVRACGQGTHGTATVRVTITGSSGRVSGAAVSGQFAGTPEGSCIARAVRGARFPRFSRSSLSVTFPFRL